MSAARLSVCLRTCQESRTGGVAALLLGALVPAASLAHTQDGSIIGFAAGVLHPWAGLDHLIAMLLVGFWAMQRGGHARWACPLMFVVVMVAGSTVGALGVAPATIDQLTALSVVTLGALIALQTRLPLWSVATIIAAFAFIHGHAHGIDMPAQAQRLAFTAGFAASTLALHLGGVLVAATMVRRCRSALLRVAGATGAMAGVVLLAVGTVS